VKKTAFRTLLAFAIGAMVLPVPGAAQRGGGPFAGVQSISVRGNREITSEASNILGWRAGIAADSMGAASFSDAAAKVDAAGTGYIEGSSKTLDYNMTDADVAKVKNRLAELRLRMPVYDAGVLPGDAAARRKLLNFAKALGADTIVGSADAAALADLDRLATEAGVKIAIAGVAAGALQGRSESLGAAVDTAEQAAAAKGRVLVATLRNAGTIAPLLSALSQQEPPTTVPWPPACADCAGPMTPVKPTFIAINVTGGAAAVKQTIDAFAKAVQPIEGARINQISKNTPITSTDSVPVLDRLMIQATTERLTAVAPKQPRKLLVIDLCPQGGFYHRTIAHANLWIEQAAKRTGAFTPTFNNDLDNLKYPKIKEYDAIFLNSVVGPVFADPEVIGGLTRFVREGGGVVGIHGSTYASQDVPEYGEMMGATAGPHRIETSMLRVEDPNSPITKQFQGPDYGSVDEHYRFPPTTPYTREKLHVLLSINNAKSVTAEWKGIRPDEDYAMAWVRSYGQGRVFTTVLGHTPQLLGTPELSQMVFAGTQYALGDLAADATPSAKVAAKK
jgi:type 1 glutamine amidotransferase